MGCYMSVPEQVRKQTEAVQELYKQLNTDDAEVETKDATEAPADEDTAPVLEDTAPTSEDAVQEDFEHKYKTLQGMYNAEVPRLHQQNRELTQRIQQMEQLLASLSAQQSTPSAPQQPVEKLITDKDVEEYGESLDVMRKVSREELGPVVQRLAQIESLLQQMQTSVVPQVQTLAHRQQMSAEQQFWADLAAGVPNFREINSNEAFQSWLLEADPLTGITRQTYLEDAQRALDAQRVVNIFRAWLGATGQSTGRVVGSELEKQIAPRRSRSSGAPTANNAKVYTPSDIAKFFNDVRAGKYKGREQERDRIERDIFAAQRENRIQFNA